VLGFFTYELVAYFGCKSQIFYDQINDGFGKFCHYNLKINKQKRMDGVVLRAIDAYYLNYFNYSFFISGGQNDNCRRSFKR
jgi:hypothetical protein